MRVRSELYFRKSIIPDVINLASVEVTLNWRKAWKKKCSSLPRSAHHHHTHVNTYECTHTHALTHTHTHGPNHTGKSTKYTYLHTHAHTHTCMLTHACTRRPSYTNTYICAQTHVHTQICWFLRTLWLGVEVLRKQVVQVLSVLLWEIASALSY